MITTNHDNNTYETSFELSGIATKPYTATSPNFYRVKTSTAIAGNSVSGILEKNETTPVFPIRRVCTYRTLENPINTSKNQKHSIRVNLINSLTKEVIKKKFCNMKLEGAFIKLSEHVAVRPNATIVFCSIYFNNYMIRLLKDNKEHPKLARDIVLKRLNLHKINQPSIMALEIGDEKRGLIDHAHVITVIDLSNQTLSEGEALLKKQFSSKLVTSKSSNGIHIQTTYKEKVYLEGEVLKRYLEDVKRYGEPSHINKVNTANIHAHWLKARLYLDTTNSESGNKCPLLKVEREVDIGSADYMSKQITSKKIQAQRLATLGLNQKS